jgi:glutaredoxin
MPTVTFYWRPNCPFCMYLRHGLHRAGVELQEINIWEDPEAAAVVRSHANGNETVPTVVIGDWAGVNPRVREVLAQLSVVPDAS